MNDHTTYQIEDNDFPFVIVRLNDAVTEDFMKTFLERWSGWLQQGKPFCMLYFYEGTNNNHPSEVKKMRKQWLKENKTLIKNNMAGMAMVVRASTVLKILKPIANTVAKKIFGCPVKVFAWEEETEAKAWLQKQMNEFKN